MASPTTTQAYTYRQLQLKDSGGSVLWRWTLVLTLCAAAALAYVWLRSNTQQLVQKRQTLARQEEILSKEVSNLRLTAESFRNPQYILQAVERYKLGLSQPSEGQVRRVSLIAGYEPEISAAEAMLARR